MEKKNKKIAVIGFKNDIKKYIEKNKGFTEYEFIECNNVENCIGLQFYDYVVVGDFYMLPNYKEIIRRVKISLKSSKNIKITH